MTNIRITISPDLDAEHLNPASYDCEWKPISFSSKFINYEDPENYLKFENGKIVPATEELKEKFEQGFAFLLDYYEHGLGMWSIHGTGPSSTWDNTSCAGILLWNHKAEDMGAKTPDEREKDAKRFLERYTDWCNGTCHYFEIHKITDCEHCGQEIKETIETDYSRQGHVGDDIEDAIRQDLFGVISDYPDAHITFAGDGSHYGSFVKIPTPDEIAEAEAL